VVATDYAGLGTPGPAQFLIGRSEANDLVNSVRALDDVPGADPGREWAVMGHSQGGHSALWAGLLADELMPERPLVGVGAIAPAADLVRIIGAQWDTGIGWGVGAEVYASWPYVYPSIDFDRVVTATGRRWAGPVADACLGEGVPVPAIIGFGAAWLGQPFFDGNPVRAQDMYDAAAEQTPAPLPATLPLMIAQGTADAVIPPEANAILQESWCAAGSNLTMLWLGGIGHIQSLQVAAPTVVPWLRARFADPPPRPSCDWVPPIGVPQAVLRDVGAALD
jgi:pimeloyl-ACP methyl ester carboxylesterase